MKKSQQYVMKISIFVSLGMIILFVGLFAYDFAPRQTEVAKAITFQSH